MSEHLPEPGQVLWGSAFLPYPVHPLLEAALRSIASEIERVEWNRRQEEFHSPMSGFGSEDWACEEFVARPHCWCDGTREDHAEGCPPNFEWRDLRIAWYKHVGRGLSANRNVPPDEMAELLVRCLEAVRMREAEPA